MLQRHVQSQEADRGELQQEARNYNSNNTTNDSIYNNAANNITNNNLSPSLLDWRSRPLQMSTVLIVSWTSRKCEAYI